MPEIGEVRTFVVEYTWRARWLDDPLDYIDCYYIADKEGRIGLDSNNPLAAFTEPVAGLVVAKCVAGDHPLSLWEPIGEFDTKEPIPIEESFPKGHPIRLEINRRDLPGNP